MLWRNPHRRFQGRLSAYLDGELPPEDALALESHLESCEVCAEELADMRLLSSVLAELQEVDVPRSFALTQDQVARPTAAPQSIRSINNGLRLTGGALAAALAVVLVLDIGGVVGDTENGGQGASTEIQSGAAYDMASREGQNPLGPLPLESPGEGGDGEQPGETAGMGGVGGGAAGSPVPSPQPTATPPESSTREEAALTPAPEPPDSTQTPADAAAELGSDGGEAEATGPLANADTNVDSDDGLSALTVAEIVLAALLGASIIGMGAATYAGRRRG